MQHTATRLSLTLLCIGLPGWALGAHAEDSILRTPLNVQRLPDMHAEELAPGRFELDGSQAAIGYEARRKKWDARVDGYLNGTPSFSIDYGKLFSNEVGMGLRMVRRQDYSEVLVNGIYAPSPDVRIQLTSGQLRAGEDAFAAAGDGVLQNSYLLGIRRQWDEQMLSPNIGVAAYTVEASGDSGTEAPNAGTLNGYMLNLSLQPTPQSRIEWRRDLGYLTQEFDQHLRNESAATADRIGYEYQFNNCMRLHSRFSLGETSGRLELALSRKRWDIGVSQTQGDVEDMAVRVGYRIPLNGKRSHVRSCTPELERAPAFEPIVDATVKRPPHLPQMPITDGETVLNSGVLVP